MVGEIGGSAEEDAAEYIQAHVTKPVVAYRRRYRPFRQAHGTCRSHCQRWRAPRMAKFAALEAAGVATVRSPADIGAKMAELMA